MDTYNRSNVERFFYVKNNDWSRYGRSCSKAWN